MGIGTRRQGNRDSPCSGANFRESAEDPGQGRADLGQPPHRLGAAAAARGEPLKVTVFPGAHHGFDAPGATVIHRTDVPNGVAPGHGVHVGANPEMRDKANAKLRAFLDEALRARAGD